jgi:serine phosphatase RsbU (regulator of sigma subunit)
LAVLKEIGEDEAIRVHFIFTSGATIGRHHENAVILHDPSLSRFHARIDHQNGRFYIQDLSSRNGIFVNDAKVRRREIKDFDRITIGETMLLFRIGSSALDRTNPLLHTQEEFLAAVKSVSQRAKNAATPDEILEIAARFAVKITGAERAAIFLHDNNRTLQPVLFHDTTDGGVRAGAFEVSRPALIEAEESGEIVFQEECLDDPRYKHDQCVQARQLNTIICLPLKSLHPLEPVTMPDSDSASGAPHEPAEAKRGQGEHHANATMLGVFYLDSRLALKGMPQHRHAMLTVLADQVALTIENTQLQKERWERRQLSKQIRAAKDAQQRLFPPPSFAHARFDMAYRYAPAQQIGGDYLAFLPLSDSRFLIAIGDVVGKGLPAGLVVMTLHGGLCAEISHYNDLLLMVHNLDRMIYEYAHGKVFVTFFAGVLDADSMQFQYTNAGHNPPLLFRRAAADPSAWRELSAVGMPLGLVPHSERAQETFSLQCGDLLMLYTDGMSEAQDGAQKQFGKEGLKEALNGWLAAPDAEKSSLTELIDTVFARVQHFTDHRPLEDDTTLMALMVK